MMNISFYLAILALAMIAFGYWFEKRDRYGVSGMTAILVGIFFFAITLLVEVLATYDDRQCPKHGMKFSTVIVNVKPNEMPKRILLCKRRLFMHDSAMTDIVMPGQFKTYHNAVIVDQSEFYIGL